MILLSLWVQYFLALIGQESWRLPRPWAGLVWWASTLTMMGLFLYTHEVGQGSSEPLPSRKPLQDPLASALHERWCEELGLGEVKLTLRPIPRLDVWGSSHPGSVKVGVPPRGFTSVESFVLAHELGHLQQFQGRWDRWEWLGPKLMIALAVALGLRFKNVAPLAPVLLIMGWEARNSEYNADALAAKLVGSEAAAHALQEMQISGWNFSEVESIFLTHPTTANRIRAVQELNFPGTNHCPIP